MNYFDAYSLKNNKANDKPNEDVYICNNETGIYIVLDGVSRDKHKGKYPKPSPALEITELVAKELYDALLMQMKSDSINLKSAFKSANKKAKMYNLLHLVWVKKFWAGTVGVICVTQKSKLYYAYIGDCSGYYLHDSILSCFTKKQTLPLSNNKGKYTTSEIRNKICNDRTHPCGYGVINGRHGAMDFVVSGSLEFNSTDTIYLSSDGCDNIFTDAEPCELLLSSARDLINKYSLGENQDDRTFVIIRNQR